MELLFFMNSQAFGTFSRKMADDIGLIESVFLTELVEKRFFHRAELVSDPKHGDGWFYHTIDRVQSRIGLSKHSQQTALRNLIKLGFVEMKTFGIPCKRYFRICDKAVLKYFGINDIADTILEDKNQNLLSRNPVNCDAGNRSTLYKEYNTRYKSRMKKEEEDAPPFGDAKKSSFPPTSSSSPPLLKSELIPQHKVESVTPQKVVESVRDSAVESRTVYKDNEDKIEVEKGVNVTKSEHEKLVIKYGLDLVKEGYKDLSEWKLSASPTQVRKHASDYYRLRKWVLPSLKEEVIKESQLRIAKHRRGSHLVTPGDYDEDNFRRERI